MMAERFKMTDLIHTALTGQPAPQQRAQRASAAQTPPEPLQPPAHERRRPIGQTHTREVHARMVVSNRQQQRDARAYAELCNAKNDVQHAKINVSQRCFNTLRRGTGISSPAAVYRIFAPANLHTSPSGEVAMMDILLSEADIQRFNSKIKKIEAGCWIWTDKATTKGYGRFWQHGGFFHYAHRVAYCIKNGPILDGLQIDHTCRNRLCVNPAHLEAVTSDENRKRGAQFIGQTNTPRIGCATCGGEMLIRTSGKYANGKMRMLRYCPPCAAAYRKKRWLEKRI